MLMHGGDCSNSNNDSNGSTSSIVVVLVVVVMVVVAAVAVAEVLAARASCVHECKPFFSILHYLTSSANIMFLLTKLSGLTEC
jgi:hypothetical protein